jgi:hypothetical protein
MIEMYLRVEGRRKRTLGAYFFCFFNLYFSYNQDNLTKSINNTLQTSEEIKENSVTKILY